LPVSTLLEGGQDLVPFGPRKPRNCRFLGLQAETRAALLGCRDADIGDCWFRHLKTLAWQHVTEDRPHYTIRSYRELSSVFLVGWS
jgi:hypothetical protein